MWNNVLCINVKMNNAIPFINMNDLNIHISQNNTPFRTRTRKKILA